MSGCRLPWVSLLTDLMNEWSWFFLLFSGRNTMKATGLMLMPEGFCTDYNPAVNPAILNEFASAAFRWHTLVQVKLLCNCFSWNCFVVCSKLHFLLHSGVLPADERERPGSGKLPDAENIQQSITAVPRRRNWRGDVRSSGRQVRSLWSDLHWWCMMANNVILFYNRFFLFGRSKTSSFLPVRTPPLAWTWSLSTFNEAVITECRRTMSYDEPVDSLQCGTFASWIAYSNEAVPLDLLKSMSKFLVLIVCFY